MTAEPLALIPRPARTAYFEGHTYASPELRVSLMYKPLARPGWYRLTVDTGSIRIEARGTAGWVHGMATLIQLLPPEAQLGAAKRDLLHLSTRRSHHVGLEDVIGFLLPRPVQGMFRDSPSQGHRDRPWDPVACTLLDSPRSDLAQRPLWKLPNLQITDQPDLEWRGLSFDCARHFFPRSMVCRVVDHLARYKMNVLHWHLTDDQGWRLEIPTLPRLHEAGSGRTVTGTADSPTYLGHYSRQDIQYIVAYAQDRGVRIIPEIDMPGHCGALLAAMPHVGCEGRPEPVPTQWGVLTNYLCPGKEDSFALVERILAEVAELFPGSPIHLGGDEVRDLTVWESCPHCRARIAAEGLESARGLEGYFMKRVLASAKKLGIDTVIWDDGAHHLGHAGKGSPRIQTWHNLDQAQEAAVKGYKVIASTAKATYFDMYYHEPQPVYWLQHISTKDVQAWDPRLDFPRGLEGIEAALWTEYCPTPADVEWRLFPRLPALAETAWGTHGTWADYAPRARRHADWLKASGTAAYDDPSIKED